MSTQTTAVGVPEWDLSDRLRKSLREAELSVHAMSEYLDVDRKTVGNYLNGRTTPTTATLRVWALRTGASYTWLRTGALPENGPETGPGQQIVAYTWKQRTPGQVLTFPAARPAQRLDRIPA